MRNIYVRQSYYAALNNNVFNCLLKTAREPADVTEAGRLFHKRGPATAKDRSSAAVFERVRPTKGQPDLLDRKRKLEAAGAVGPM